MNVKRIAIAPHMITWALERAGLDALTLAQSKAFRDVIRWESGEVQPTLKQLEKFAKAVHIPIGYLFLPSPLEEKLPIADFRTIGGQRAMAPSPNLLDTIYQCQQRQDWYRDYARMEGLEPLSFIGSAHPSESVEAVACAMHEALDFSLQEQQSTPNWEEALRLFKAKVEDAGILLMTNGVVGSNTQRKLQVEEFRGFALSDPFAPLIFINNSDSKAAQMFTLTHELAHLWLGESGVSNTQAGSPAQHSTEVWCNAVAAEFLMPLQQVRDMYDASQAFDEQVQALARIFKVSSLVVIRRLYDANFIDESILWQKYQYFLAQMHTGITQGKGGGSFYNNLFSRTSKRFTRALLASTLEGNTLFRDAFQLLGVKKSDVIHKAAAQLGVRA